MSVKLLVLISKISEQSQCLLDKGWGKRRRTRWEPSALAWTGKDGAWTKGMAVEGKVTRGIMGSELASLADTLDESMREREASRITPWGAISRGTRHRRGGKSRVLFYSVVTVETLDYQMDLSWRQVDIWKAPEKPGLSSKRGSDS